MALSDWDKLANKLELSNAHFISPPTSVKISEGVMDIAVCRILAARNLPQGRVVTWFRGPADGYNHIHFRNQSPLDTVSYDNLYYVSFQPAFEVDLGKYVGGAGGDIDSWPFAAPIDTWYKVRLTWWILPPINDQSRLAVRLEVLEDDEWVSYGDLQDPQASFESSEINRVGLVVRSLTSFNDDFEIWGPA